jgi:hypothetical protein
MMSSNALNIIVGIDGSDLLFPGFVFLINSSDCLDFWAVVVVGDGGGGGGDVEMVILGLWVLGFSSILTADMLKREGREKDVGCVAVTRMDFGTIVLG